MIRLLDSGFIPLHFGEQSVRQCACGNGCSKKRRASTPLLWPDCRAGYFPDCPEVPDDGELFEPLPGLAAE